MFLIFSTTFFEYPVSLFSFHFIIMSCTQCKPHYRYILSHKRCSNSVHDINKKGEKSKRIFQRDRSLSSSLFKINSGLCYDDWILRHFVLQSQLRPPLGSMDRCQQRLLSRKLVDKLTLLEQLYPSTQNRKQRVMIQLFCVHCALFEFLSVIYHYFLYCMTLKGSNAVMHLLFFIFIYFV